LVSTASIASIEAGNINAISVSIHCEPIRADAFSIRISKCVALALITVRWETSETCVTRVMAELAVSGLILEVERVAQTLEVGLKGGILFT
jgi:hypothetical protein